MFKRDNNIMNGKGEQDIDWVTVNGTHIPIKDGENVSKAINQKFRKTEKDKTIFLDKQEYAELCSAIRTKYGNRIPKDGFMLYNDYFYMYNYTKRYELIVCTFKIEIEGNEDIITKQEEKLNGR